MSIREDFILWLNAGNKEGSGKANSYIIGLSDSDKIAQHFNSKFKVPSVYEMPDESLLSLREFISAEKRKEAKLQGASELNSVENLHGISYWRDGFCSAAITKLLEFKSYLSRCVVENDVLKLFRKWLSYPERNHGKGYKVSTVDRYVEAMSTFDNVLSEWGIDLGGRKLHQVTDPAEFAVVEASIRACPEFASYNGNRNAEGQCRNLNGTGWGDPSAALTQFRLYLETGAEKEPDAANVVFDISAAVKLFTTHRLDEDWVKVLKRDGYEGLHERYAAMNPETLRGMNAAEFDAWVDRELWAARTFFCGQNIKKLSDADKKAFCEFIAATKKNFRRMSNYLGKEAKLPNGVGPVVATELLMKFHPLDYCNYNVLMLQGLKVLGLVESDKMPSMISVAMYQKLMGHVAMLLEKLTDAGVPRRFDEGPDAKPDYITVNEFLWWCKEHQDLIKEEIMKQNQIKAEPGFPEGQARLI